MSRSKATKRRKVWVNLYPDGRHTLYRTRKEALKIRGLNSEGTVPMVEHLPGDVVLSREDVWVVASLVAKAELAVGLEYLPWHDSTEGSPEQAVVKDALAAVKQILALLRGRR